MRFIWKTSVLGSLSAIALACSQSPETLVHLPAPVGESIRAALATSSETPPSLVTPSFPKGELLSRCKREIEEAVYAINRIVNLPAQGRNFDSTVLAYEKAGADLGDRTAPLTFLGYVSTDAETRREASACEEELGRYYAETSGRADLYESIREARPRNGNEKRLHEEQLRAFENNGLKLPPEKLAEVTRLSSRLSELQSRFGANIAADARELHFTDTELAGLSPRFLARLKRDAEGRLIVHVKDAEYMQVMSAARSPQTRRSMMAAYVDRAGSTNVPILEEALSLRQRIASLMGFASWADYRVRGRMARDAGTVMRFLESLRSKLSRRNQSDLDKLLAFKKELDPGASSPGSSSIDTWDTLFLTTQLRKRDFSVDDEKIREYFPAEPTVRGMLEVYSRLFGVSFVEYSDAAAWAPEVRLFRIEDSADGRVIGYFYADLFPRAGKYTHAAAFPLVSGRVLSDGSYSRPVAALVANLTSPDGNKPALLSHQEVLTLFHEFGHIMHQTLTRAPYASLSGSNVTQDFVEAPSQMLENWVWQPEILERISGHYLSPSEKLPRQLLERMVEARKLGKGVYYTKQLMLALLDMRYHLAAGPVDTTALQLRLHREITGLDAIPGTRAQASFGHLLGGYDAAYYGYLWSDVYAADLFTRFESGHLLDPEAGLRYRREILEPGNMRDGLDLLRGFLGREPDPDAFLKKLLPDSG